jgi:hypothetical protein
MYRVTVRVKYVASVIVCSVKVVLNVHCKAKEIKDLSSHGRSFTATSEPWLTEAKIA